MKATKQHAACCLQFVVAGFVFAANPLFTDKWTADPAPLVDCDTLYLFTGHDDARDGEMFHMEDWLCFSTKDLKTWTDHGAFLRTDYTREGNKENASVPKIEWTKDASAWAAQCVKSPHDGKYYFYFCAISKTDGMSVGVAVADRPTGPYHDALGKPLVRDCDTPSPYWGNDIDPSVFIDADGTPWMVWGNPVCYLAKLKENMTELDGDIRVIPLPNYTEGPWLDKRGSTYYLIYPSRAHQGFGEHLDYATASSVEGPWIYRGRLTGGAWGSYTIHPGLCSFKGRDILFYHDGHLTINGVGGATGRRGVCAEFVDISPNGPIAPFEQTREGLDKTGLTGFDGRDNPVNHVNPVKKTFKEVPFLGTKAEGFSFSECGVSAYAQPTAKGRAEGRKIDSFVRWDEGAAYKSVGNPFMDSPQCDGFNMHGERKDAMVEEFALDKDLRLAKICLYLTDGEGTDKDNPLALVLRESAGAEIFSVPLDYVPQGYGIATLTIEQWRQPFLKAGVRYALELRGKKGSAVAYWRRGFDGKKPHGFALYGASEAVKLFAPNELCVLAYQTPGKKGGLSFLVGKPDGTWEHAFHKDFRFTYSNLGGWAEKSLMEPFVLRANDGAWHVFFPFEGRPALGHAESWNAGNIRNWGRERWIELGSGVSGQGSGGLDPNVRVRSPIAEQLKDGSFAVLFLDNDGGAWAVKTDGKVALAPSKKIERSVYDKARRRLVKKVEFDGRAFEGAVVAITPEMREMLRSEFGEWKEFPPWFMGADNVKDDVARYGEAAKDARLTMKFDGAKDYAISTNLIGVFFEDINSSHEIFTARKGWREDMVKALADLKPKFMRFPGGCIVHGRDFNSMYRWKETVGPFNERKGKPNPCWGGHQDFELGYYEYFVLCEKIGAEPVPILSAGVSCPNPQVAVSPEELKELVADALDLVEFANGDPQKSKWAKLRADMGHPAPFNLKYMGVGNEDDINDYFERGFTAIYSAMRKKHPEIKIVGSAGPAPGGRDYEEGWKLGKKLKVDILDEHYYVGPGWFYGNQRFYDDYDRKGPKVYVGEYAAHKEGRVNDMETACATAIHLCNVERNGDIVEMTSYAPLFAKRSDTRWAPDLIYFTDDGVELTTDYWVQWLFGNYSGSRYVPNSLELVTPNSKLNKDDQARFRNRFAASVVKDGKKTILKVVNSTQFPMPFEADLSPLGVKNGTKAEVSVLASAFDDKSAKPATTSEKIDAKLARTLPANSLTVIVF